MIRWLKKRKVKDHIAKASTRTSRYGKNTKKEKFKESGVLDVGQALF